MYLRQSCSDGSRSIQELSYRKQIARKLRTQFVEGISVTLKSTFRVTQGHWKRNHWTDHTWLSSSRVIWRWILSWPWNVDKRSLKVIESGTIWKLGYGFLFAFHSNYGGIFSHFGSIQRQRMIWPWNLGFGVLQGLLTFYFITQGHWNWCHSKAWVRFPVRFLSQLWPYL